MRRIVQEVNAAQDLEQALSIIVQRVREALETQSCTVFLMEKDQQHVVLMATEGLNKDVIGKVKVPVGHGLIGLIGQKGELFNLDKASEHPSFIDLEGAGEERFNAFLGVPIIHHRRILGVLVVQQQEARRFDEAEEAFLITMSAQLAGVIANAEASGKVGDICEPADKLIDVTFLDGIPSVPGVGIGHAIVVYPLADLTAVPEKSATDIDAEIQKLNAAIIAVREDIQVMQQRMASSLPDEELAIFDVYLKMLDSHSLSGEITEHIKNGLWAQGALKKVILEHVKQFEEMDDEYLRERVTDIKDIGRRVLMYLQRDKHNLPEYPEQTILIGEEVTAAALVEVPEGKLAGVVSAKGSSNSHVAILARALGVPTVMGVNNIPANQLEGVELIVNGYHGRVYIAPPLALHKEFTLLAQEERQLDEELENIRDLPAETPDNKRLSLYVNTGLVADVERSLSAGAEGVGLYRTEVPFMSRERFPGEEEQRAIYRQLLTVFSPRPVVMRTLDIGGDKMLPYFPIQEENPFLGWRGIRITLDHPEIFTVQLRAMLKASEGLDNLHIMFPMISCLTEADDAILLLQKTYQDLREEGLNITYPKIGVMIEIPSAVTQAGELAKRFDFLSVGSNDLTQYILAVDRNNTRVANLYNALHPAVIRALQEVVMRGHEQGKTVSICGEMAGDPASVVLLLALGFDSLSMSAASLPRVKWVIRNLPLIVAEEALHNALSQVNPQAVRRQLERVLIEHDLGGLIWAGK